MKISFSVGKTLIDTLSTLLRVMSTDNCFIHLKYFLFSVDDFFVLADGLRIQHDVVVGA